MTRLHLHRLAGLTPEPLGAWLGAVGVLRLVGSQADESARGFWRDDTFCLLSALDEAELLSFFLHDYAPTPMLSPWNGGSGFYPKDTKAGIEALAASPAPRFRAFRRMIDAASAQVGERTAAPKSAPKAALIGALRACVGAELLDWLDASVAVTADSDPKYPSLLGTGGNDGRLDFTNNLMQRLCELFDPTTGAPAPHAPGLLEHALFGRPTAGLTPDPVGQYQPGAAGGANAANGYAGSASLDPWDFVLLLEGAVMSRVAVTRRLDGAGLAQAAAPFAVRSRAADYASAAPAEEGSRGELWFPLWTRALSVDELSGLFRQARLQTGRRAAQSAVEAGRAIARLGVSRGVTEFVRFGIAERNGQANLAVPLGRWHVRAPVPHTRLLDELDPWLLRLRRAATDKAPASFGRALRAIETASMTVCRAGGRPADWCRMLEVLGAAEALIVSAGKTSAQYGLQPLPALSPEWLLAANDGSCELRLAAGIAAQRGPDRPDTFGSIRVHCLPLDARRPGRFATAGGGSDLAHDPRVVWRGRDLAADLAAVVQRRLLEAASSRSALVPLRAPFGVPMRDIQAFLAGDVDEARLSLLARALMALRWLTPEAREPAAALMATAAEPEEGHDPSPVYALFRLALPSIRLRDDLLPRTDRSIVRRLVAGNVDAAAQVAVMRLRAAGVTPRVRRAVGSADYGRRLAASLALPVSYRDLYALLRSVTRSPRVASPTPLSTPSTIDQT